MNLMQLRQFCTLFHASHYIPIFIYGEGELPEYAYTAVHELFPSHYVRKQLSGEQNPQCFYASETGMWGYIYVPSLDHTVICGPVFSGKLTSEMLHGFMNWHGFPADRKGEISDYLNSIPKYTYYRFLNMLAFLHFTLNGETIGIMEHFDKVREAYNEKISVAQTEESVNAMEDVRQHGTYSTEQRLIDFIRAGEVEKLRDFLSVLAATSPLQEGKLAESPIRQAKNIFIGAATIFGKDGAIPGGLGVEETYQLIDTYIQECERLSSVEAITALQYNMLIDFTARVAENRIPDGISADIHTAIQFIDNHTNEPISIDTVAEHIGKSRAYLTAKFRKETGKSVNEYIRDKKLSESKSLLKHTNKSLSEIAYFLCFSSQNYYQTVFKKKYGETPTEYRKRFLKI